MQTNASRLQPVIETIGQFGGIEDLIVLTDESLLFQIYGNEDMDIIDLGFICTEIPQAEFDKLIANKLIKTAEWKKARHILLYFSHKSEVSTHDIFSKFIDHFRWHANYR